LMRGVFLGDMSFSWRWAGYFGLRVVREALR
jgi:hypothetical protein